MTAMAMPRLILLVAALLTGAGPLHADVTLVDNAALERLMRRGVPVIDIRTPEEWRQTGIIEGSHMLTFFDAQGTLRCPRLAFGARGHRVAGRSLGAHLRQRRGAAPWSAGFWTRGSATGTSSTCPEGLRNGRRRIGRPSLPASTQVHCASRRAYQARECGGPRAPRSDQRPARAKGESMPSC